MTEALKEFVRFFKEGGWWMYLVLLAGLTAVVGGLVHAISARRATLGLALAPLALVLVIGGIGTFADRAEVDSALALVSPKQKDKIRVEGYKEASRPIQLAVALAAVALLPFIAGEARRGRSS